MQQTLGEQLAARLAEREAEQKQAINDAGDTEVGSPTDAEPIVEPRENEPAPDPSLQDATGADAVASEGEEGAQKAGEQTYTPKSLAEAIGWTAEDLYRDLNVPFADGKSMTLGELKDAREETVRMRADLDNERNQFAQEQSNWARQSQAQAQHGAQRSKEITEAQQAMDVAQAKYNLVPWDEIEKQNPGQAANLRQRIEMEYAQAKRLLDQAQQSANTQAEQQYQQALWEHEQNLVRLVPQWRDQNVRQQEFSELSQFLVERFGFRPDELPLIQDSRAQAVARMAWEGSKKAQEAQAALSKVRAAPKQVMRSGNGQRVDANKAETEKLKQRAIATGRDTDKVAAARAIIGMSTR